MVTSNENRVRIVQGLYPGQVNCVVASEALLLGQLPSAVRDSLSELNDVQLQNQTVELGDCRTEPAGCEPTKAMCLGKCRPSFGVHQPNGRNAIGCIPQAGGSERAWLVDNEWEHCRRVEIGDHRRCSAIRSLTRSLLSIRLADRER